MDWVAKALPLFVREVVSGDNDLDLVVVGAVGLSKCVETTLADARASFFDKLNHRLDLLFRNWAGVFEPDVA